MEQVFEELKNKIGLLVDNDGYHTLPCEKREDEKPFLVIEHLNHEKSIKILQEEIELIKQELRGIHELTKQECDNTKKICRTEAVDISYEQSKEFFNNHTKELNDTLSKRLIFKIGRLAIIDTKKFDMREIR